MKKIFFGQIEIKNWIYKTLSIINFVAIIFIIAIGNAFIVVNGMNITDGFFRWLSIFINGMLLCYIISLYMRAHE